MSGDRLHVVTDDEVLARDGFLRIAAAVIEAGGNDCVFHLRGHGTAARRLFDHATALHPLARRDGARLVVNDRVDVAFAAGADGVQLGRRGLPVVAVRRLAGSIRIGYSAHAATEAVAAEGWGVDWILVGTIYETSSHPGSAAGIGLVRATAAATSVPLVAIGGVTPERVSELVAAGAAGVAVRGGIWDDPDPGRAAGDYRRALAQAGGRHA